MTVYFISGLGADERVFQCLDLPGIDRRFIQWLDPLKRETIHQYAGRLGAQIDPLKDVILVGISFGGLIAQEIARQMVCKQVIIISSITSPAELSLPLKLARFTKLYKLFPAFVLKWSNALTADYYFSTKSEDESALLKQIIADTDEAFMTWAIHQIMCWKNHPVQPLPVHIHGTADRIFPVRPLHPATMIRDGGHFMIVNKASELSEVLMRVLHSIK